MDFYFIVTIASAWLEILFLDGLIIGWDFLQYVLQREGYFNYLCNNATIVDKTWSQWSTPRSLNFSKFNCKNEEVSFNLVYTLSMSTFFMVSFPSGWLFDYLSNTWLFRSVATILFTSGLLLLALSSPAMSVLLYPAMIILANSGYALLISNIQLANLKSSTRNSITTLLNGTFESGAIVFFIVKKLYGIGVNFYTMIYILISLTVFIWIRTFLFTPKTTIPFPLRDERVNYGWKEWNLCQSHEEEDSAEPLLPQNENTAQISTANEVSIWDCLKSKLYWTCVYHTTVFNFRLIMFYGGLYSWLRTLVESKYISEYIDVFGVILLFTFTAAILNGLLLDLATKYFKSKMGDETIYNLKASLVSMTTSSGIAILLSIMVLIPSIYGAFVMYLLGIGFIYGGCMAFIMTHFPDQHMGKLIGLLFFCSGAAILFQNLVFQLALKYDPSFYYLNVGLLVLTISTLIHPAVIFSEIYKR